VLQTDLVRVGVFTRCCILFVPLRFARWYILSIFQFLNVLAREPSEFRETPFVNECGSSAAHWAGLCLVILKRIINRPQRRVFGKKLERFSDRADYAHPLRAEAKDYWLYTPSSQIGPATQRGLCSEIPWCGGEYSAGRHGCRIF